ncbi:MAG: chemotaxis protein CheC [Candidatus Thorarchaeota archaeon]
MRNDKNQFGNLTELQLDALQEVGNIGAGHAAIGLTQFLNRSTYMSIPNVALDNLQAISRLVKMPGDQDVAIISLHTISDLLYTLLVFFNGESVRKIIKLMTVTTSVDSEDLYDISPLFLSLIKETGSILLLKYVEALNYFLKANSFPSPPRLRIGTIASLTQNELKDVIQNLSTVLVIECDIFTSAKSIAIDLVIVPRLETFDQFMQKLFSKDTEDY